MAGEIYIARQDTLENVQSTVNEIDANVDTANSTLGNFAGGGTDSVVTELNALKQAVAALTTKTDGLQTDVTNIKTDVGTIETTVEQIASSGGSGWSDFKITDKSISGKSRSFSYTTTHPAIVMSEPRTSNDHSFPVSFNKTVASFSTITAGGGPGSMISFVSKGTTVTGSTDSSSGRNYCYCIIAEFV